ncbi:hypothetical protein Lbir_1371 [Legionella birminghamensis]|uniref:Uncharacterized protein n=1 Tax=Legionella birminghamensis TaxID=28083 RepID=A0A378IDK6_9GAMM|nr:hypothetical protein [Legionella birminghamensis]KTC72305.1 hypothetical protein Lbir_1371 [Legionella birminghamensis]STX32815.1 Uncharacterised protein [Legionella birminghamensis]
MFKDIHLKLISNSKTIKASQRIYSGDCEPILLSSNETFINLVSDYNEQAFLNDSEIWHILFNGKQIKQPLKTKKTGIAIQKGPYKDIYEELSGLKPFSINHQEYNLIPVDNIVLCDLLFAQGGVFEINEIHSALFFPYFLDQAKDGFKLTFIFINLLMSRFKEIACKVISSLGYDIYLDGNNLLLNTLTANDFARWLLLHEYCHNSGPLPLFSQNVNKFSKKSYGFIEELRVDLTTIKIIIENISLGILSSEFYNVIAIIMAERIFRASIYNFNQHWTSDKGMFSKEVEGDTAIAFLVLLTKFNIFDPANKILNIDIANTLQVVDMILSDIYKYEHLANEKSGFNSTHHIFSKFFRDKYFKMPVSAYDFLIANSVQDCNFYLNFMSEYE